MERVKQVEGGMFDGEFVQTMDIDNQFIRQD